jgi:hypothetical protein
MTGQIEIEFRPDVADSVRERVQIISADLQDQGISMATRQADADSEQSVLIRVEEVGDISDIHVTALLDALFDGKELKGRSVVLADAEKSFSLPDDMGECIDWFIIED